MPRPNEGWKLREPKPGKRYWTVRFTDANGDPRELGTGCIGKTEASAAAQALVTAYQPGRKRPKKPRADRPSMGVDSLRKASSSWLTATVNVYSPKTQRWFASYFKGFFVPYFKTLDAITSESMAEYFRGRLGQATRKTINKDRAVLSAFLQWCAETGLIEACPEVPRLPKRAFGTPRKAAGRRTPCTLKEIETILALLPEFSEPRKLKPGTDAKWARGYPIRARFVLIFEQGLRPEFPDSLLFPDHYKPGATHLTIEGLNDKGRKGRLQRLTDVARAALDSVLPPEPGLIFGRHVYWKVLKEAASKVLDPERARTFCPRDFRRNRATLLLARGMSLKAVQGLLGHADIAMTSKYVMEHADSVEGLVDQLNAERKPKGNRPLKKAAKG